MPCSRSHTSTKKNKSHCSRAAADLQQDQWRIVAHRWDISLQGSLQMIFDALNQGRLRPSHCPLTPSAHPAPSAKPPPSHLRPPARRKFRNEPLKGVDHASTQPPPGIKV